MGTIIDGGSAPDTSGQFGNGGGGGGGGGGDGGGGSGDKSGGGGNTPIDISGSFDAGGNAPQSISISGDGGVTGSPVGGAGGGGGLNYSFSQAGASGAGNYTYSGGGSSGNINAGGTDLGALAAATLGSAGLGNIGASGIGYGLPGSLVGGTGLDALAGAWDPGTSAGFGIGPAMLGSSAFAPAAQAVGQLGAGGLPQESLVSGDQQAPPDTTAVGGKGSGTDTPSWVSSLADMLLGAVSPFSSARAAEAPQTKSQDTLQPSDIGSAWFQTPGLSTNQFNQNFSGFPQQQQPLSIQDRIDINQGAQDTPISGGYGASWTGDIPPTNAASAGTMYTGASGPLGAGQAVPSSATSNQQAINAALQQGYQQDTALADAQSLAAEMGATPGAQPAQINPPGAPTPVTLDKYGDPTNVTDSGAGVLGPQKGLFDTPANLGNADIFTPGPLANPGGFIDPNRFAAGAQPADTLTREDQLATSITPPAPGSPAADEEYDTSRISPYDPARTTATSDSSKDIFGPSLAALAQNRPQGGGFTADNTNTIAERFTGLPEYDPNLTVGPTQFDPQNPETASIPTPAPDPRKDIYGNIIPTINDTTAQTAPGAASGAPQIADSGSRILMGGAPEAASGAAAGSSGGYPGGGTYDQPPRGGFERGQPPYAQQQGRRGLIGQIGNALHNAISSMFGGGTLGDTVASAMLQLGIPAAMIMATRGQGGPRGLPMLAGRNAMGAPRVGGNIPNYYRNLYPGTGLPRWLVPALAGGAIGQTLDAGGGQTSGGAPGGGTIPWNQRIPGDSSQRSPFVPDENSSGNTGPFLQPDSYTPDPGARTGTGAPAPPSPVLTAAQRAQNGVVGWITQRGGHTAGIGAPQLNPQFAARLQAAGAAYEQETGQRAQFGETGRSREQQAKYYAEYRRTGQGLAAPPGSSRHERGLAVDIPDGPFQAWMHRNGARFGIQGLRDPNDPNHFQMA